MDMDSSVGDCRGEGALKGVNSNGENTIKNKT